MASIRIRRWTGPDGVPTWRSGPLERTRPLLFAPGPGFEPDVDRTGLLTDQALINCVQGKKFKSDYSTANLSLQ